MVVSAGGDVVFAAKRIHLRLVLSDGAGLAFSSRIRWLSSACHPNVVPILGYAEAPGEGRPLRVRGHEEPGLPSSPTPGYVGPLEDADGLADPAAGRGGRRAGHRAPARSDRRRRQEGPSRKDQSRRVRERRSRSRRCSHRLQTRPEESRSGGGR
uniref:UvrABC system protein C n=1 Tax=Anthurium amnicola TaxID=1678845 RepID=A0A1D1ZDE9_9ARAE